MRPRGSKILFTSSGNFIENGTLFSPLTKVNKLSQTVVESLSGIIKVSHTFNYFQVDGQKENAYEWDSVTDLSSMGLLIIYSDMLLDYRLVYFLSQVIFRPPPLSLTAPVHT